MDALRLRPGISHRSFPGCAIVLDIHRDRYWKVDERLAATLDKIARRDGNLVDPCEARRAQHLGLVETGSSNAAPSAGVPAPRLSAIEGDRDVTPFRPLIALEVAYLAVTARRVIGRRPLRAVLDDVRALRSGEKRGARANAQDLARYFARYRQLVPLDPLCLPDTIAFLRFAARRGCFPRLVFGVEAWPFAAHCWAQADTCVLTDVLGHARSFSPILVL